MRLLDNWKKLGSRLGIGAIEGRVLRRAGYGSGREKLERGERSFFNGRRVRSGPSMRPRSQLHALPIGAVFVLWGYIEN